LPQSDTAVLAELRRTGELRTFACTWNMGGKSPAAHTPGGAAPADGDGAGTTLLAPRGRFHLLVYCSQECERSIAASAVNTSKARWEEALVTLLRAGADEAVPHGAARADLYRLVASHTLQATHVAVFAHRAVSPLVSDVVSEAVPCGAGGRRLGNKGAVCVGVCVGKTSLLVVGCHLAAGEGPKAVAARVSDAEHIESAATLAPADWAGPAPGRSRLSERYDRTVWLGDLNFRCDATRAFADACLRERRHQDLLARDELRAAMADGVVMRGFGEAPLRFRPTYKLARKPLSAAVHSGMSLAVPVSEEEAREAASLGPRGAGAALVDVYDPSRKRRVPSWTDRVLVRPADGRMRVVSYGSAARERLSDHRPVTACVAVRLRRSEEAAGDAAGVLPWSAGAVVVGEGEGHGVMAWGGEAADAEWMGSVHAAVRAGRRAAETVVEALGGGRAAACGVR